MDLHAFVKLATGKDIPQELRHLSGEVTLQYEEPGTTNLRVTVPTAFSAPLIAPDSNQQFFRFLTELQSPIVCTAYEDQIVLQGANGKTAAFIYDVSQFCM